MPSTTTTTTPENEPLPVPTEGNPPTTPAAAKNDAQGTGSADATASLIEKIERASANAVDQHLAESPKKRGQRGPDKQPRKKRGAVPLESMGDGTDPAHLAEGTPQPLGGFVESVPAFDEETARTVIDVGIGLLNDGASAIVRAVAKNQTGDDGLAKEAGEAVRMADKVDLAVRTGGFLCAKKYAVRMEYAPEFLLGGGLVIWGGTVVNAIRVLKSKGEEIREKEQQREAA